MNRTDALKQLRCALPADPDDHGPIAVPSDAIREVLIPEWVPCPRCSSTRQVGHAGANKQSGFTCMDCGWVRYVDPMTRGLRDAHEQPVWDQGE